MATCAGGEVAGGEGGDVGLVGRGEPGVYTALLSAPRALSPKVSHTWMGTGSKEQATNGVVRKVVVLCRAGARAA